MAFIRESMQYHMFVSLYYIEESANNSAVFP